MPYRIYIAPNVEDYLIDHGRNLSKKQRSKLKAIIDSIKSEPFEGKCGPPHPISLYTQYYVNRSLGENIYVLIGYDVNNYAHVIDVKAIFFSDFKVEYI